MKKKTRIFLGILSIIVVLLVVAYLLIPSKNSTTVSNFILQRRLLKLLVMVIVSCAIPISTISFQTVVQNRFLTPGVLGIESLFVFIQSGLYYFESLIGLKVEQSTLIYAVTITIQIMLVLLLMNISKGMLLSNFKVLLLLTMAFSILLRNASTFLQVLMDPNEFDKLQSSLYPSFQKMNAQPILIFAALVLFGLLMIVFFKLRHKLDALHLGVDGAKMLGINTKRLSNVVIVIVIIMTSLSTILVGPLQFLGFMIANLTYQLTKEYKHGVLWLFSAILGLVIVLSAQLIVERVFLLTIPISVFIEGIGGVLYLILLVKGAKPGAA
ncbi:iron chelate uptake ABC transporter family permease subunit [Granulicatella adiacens]|uniref:iron chelate uptake ABC transporter family permease subunit n=1 Tax=Granulicatella adiacens TaxID=46124 RepID=UPI0021D9F93A|nr:iron chelate uptake ABC transporter family permease subunit [Granulicatella adiacens]UXY40615.1 iron chelate uptake ABC transporter family permease subunit [Granulicatella adiacens]